MDLDFLEIGTSNFSTCIEGADDNTRGISVEPIKHYLDALPNKANVIKVNAAITSNRDTSTVYIYYIPEEIIDKYKIFYGMKGCNSINDYHPLHRKYGLESLVVKEAVKLLNIEELLESYNIRSIEYLQIDTEGHDVVILGGLFNYLGGKPRERYPKRIRFESNEHTAEDRVTEIIIESMLLGYRVVERGYDTVLELS